MPAVSLVCPHCEKPVEIQVAGVTRTRPCPSCGETLVLQMAEKNTKARRRALLMGGAVPEVPKDRPLNLPQKQKPVSAAKIAPADQPPPPASKAQLSTPVDSAPPSPADKESTVEAKPPTAEIAREAKKEPPTDSMPRSMNFTPSHEPQALPGDAFERMRFDPEIREFRKRLIIGSCLVLVGIVIVILLSQLTSSSVKSTPQSTAPEDLAPAALAPTEAPLPPVPEGGLVFKPEGKSDFTAITASSAAPARSNPLANNLEASLSVEALRKFLAAANWKERQAWSRPVAGLEQQMAAFYASHADGPVIVENIIEAQSAKDGFYHHTLVFEGGGRRSVYVEKSAKGPRVDWASFAGASERSWQELMTQRSATPALVRVMVSDAFYYENHFGNPGLLKCVKLTSVADPGAPTIHAYCDRSSDVCQKLDFWQKERGKDATFPLTLRIKYPLDAASPTQVWITEIVRDGWLVP